MDVRERWVLLVGWALLHIDEVKFDQEEDGHYMDTIIFLIG